MQRVLWIDLIRGAAIFFVIFLHSASTYLYEFQKIDMSSWWVANIYDSIVRMAVPLFFMITGVIFLKMKDEPLKVFFKKRLMKIVIPLLLWSSVYILFRKYIEGQDISVVKHIILSFFHSEYYHLWFLYTIVGVYLFIPVLKVFIDNASKKLQYYFIFLFIVSAVLIPFITDILTIEIPNYLIMMQGYGGYLVLGYLLSYIKVDKKIIWLSIFLIFSGTVITALGTYHLTLRDNQFNSFLYDNFSVSTMIQAIGFFLLLKYIGEKIVRNMFINKIILLTASLSFGIYLIHPIVMWFFENIMVYTNDIDLIYYIPLKAISVFISSALLIYLLQKIRLFKRFMVP